MRLSIAAVVGVNWWRKLGSEIEKRKLNEGGGFLVILVDVGLCISIFWLFMEQVYTSRL